MSYDLGSKMLHSLALELDKTIFKQYTSYLLGKYICMRYWSREIFILILLTFHLTPWHQITTIVITMCNAQKTKELKSSPRMYQLWHVLAKSSADTQGFDVCTCLYLSVKTVCLIRIFPHHPFKITNLIAVPNSSTKGRTMTALNAERYCSALKCFTYMPPQSYYSIWELFQENLHQTKPNQIKLVPTKHCIHITEFKIDWNKITTFKMHN